MTENWIIFSEKSLQCARELRIESRGIPEGEIFRAWGNLKMLHLGGEMTESSAVEIAKAVSRRDPGTLVLYGGDTSARMRLVEEAVDYDTDAVADRIRKLLCSVETLAERTAAELLHRFFATGDNSLRSIVTSLDFLTILFDLCRGRSAPPAYLRAVTSRGEVFVRCSSEFWEEVSPCHWILTEDARAKITGTRKLIQISNNGDSAEMVEDSRITS